MNKKDTVAELYALVADVFGVTPAEINDSVGPKDIETWDSLGQLKLIAALESHYRFTFEISEIFEILTVGALRRILTQKGKVSNATS